MTTATISRKGSSLVQLGQQRARPQGETWLGSRVFILMHVACLAVFLTGANVLALALCVACYFLQMVGITAGYHRYFSHRSYKTSRAFQFVLAWLGCSASQKGPLWWAAQHRHHHRTSDTPEDLHSPVSHSFWWSHIGWVLSAASDAVDRRSVKDLSRYPELRWLDRYHWVPPVVAGRVVLPDRRLERLGLGLLRQQRAVAPRDLHGQLALPPSGGGGATRPPTPAGTTCSWP